MIGSVIAAVTSIASPIVKSLFPDPADELKRIELEQKLTLALLEKQSDIEKAAASIVQTEAASKHWLAANWRPMLMLFFAGLIGARWFGFSAEGISPEEYIKLWDIIELGLGGYVIGRSAEKVVPSLAAALGGKK